MSRQRSMLWPSVCPTVTAEITRSSAVAERPRDALCQLKSCQLLQNCRPVASSKSGGRPSLPIPFFPPSSSFPLPSLPSPFPSLSPLFLRSRAPKPSYRGLGSAVSSPAGSGAEPHPKLNLVHFSLKSDIWWQQI